MGALVDLDDARFLLDIADTDPDARVRHEAARALSLLPLGPGAARAVLSLSSIHEWDPPTEGRLQARARVAEAGPVEPDPVAASAAARAAALELRTSLFVADTLPAGVALLGQLSAGAASAVLTDLVHQLLAGNWTSEAERRRATKRLGEAYRALSRDGTRDVVADLPTLSAVTVDPPLQAWVGSLLRHVDTGQILALAQQLSADVALRLHVLRQLAAVAPWLGSSRSLAAPTSEHELVDLQQFVQIGLTATEPDVMRGPSRSVDLDEGMPIGTYYDDGWWPYKEAIRGPGALPPDLESGSAEAEDPTPPPVSGGTPDPAPSRTRTAYALLDGPERVDPGAAFELRVGLGSAAGHGVTTPSPLTVPLAPFELTVTVVADGFVVLGGADLTMVIPVHPDDPYPYAVLRLRAVADPAFSPARTILATYSINERWIGVASRSVLVEPADGRPDSWQPPVQEAHRQQSNVDWVLSAEPGVRPDLELLVAPGNDAGDVRRLFWAFRSPHPSVGEGHSIEAELPAEVATQVKQLLAGVEARPGAVDLGHYIRGVGRLVARAVPDVVWTALAAAAAAVDGPPSVLFATWDPYVPWELARVPQPWRAGEPTFLGAQANIGRWPYLTHSRSPAPPARIELSTMAVVSGTYAEGERLPEAEQEAADLRGRYAAHDVAAQLGDVLDCLGGQPRSDLVHFSVHGAFTGTGAREGIYMIDGKFLDPVSVAGVEGSPVRFVFLNACQLGQARQIFGDYAGMAAELLNIGARAVVAPLWEVDDEVARSMAEGFYPAVLAKDESVSPASFLRTQRSSTGLGGENTPAGTKLAYVYYGHPLLQVAWNGTTNG